MNMISELRQRVRQNGKAEITAEEYDKLQAEWITRSGVDELVASDVETLRAFAQAVMNVWPMGDLDGGTLQEIATNHGLLRPETRYEPCSEGCSCAENVDALEWARGVVCYRKTTLLKG